MRYAGFQTCRRIHLAVARLSVPRRPHFTSVFAEAIYTARLRVAGCLRSRVKWLSSPRLAAQTI